MAIAADSKLVQVLDRFKTYLVQEYRERLVQVILFGSYARQDSHPASDIDVLIVLADPINSSEEIRRTSEFVAQLCLEYDLLISRLFLSQSRFETENSPLLRTIHRDGVVL
jgi:predicted nucleotidyltransferase